MSDHEGSHVVLPTVLPAEHAPEFPARSKLSDALASRAVAAQDRRDRILWDIEVPGFGLRIRPSGCTWILAYRPAGAGRSAHSIKLKIGKPPALTAAAARKAARATLARVAAGIDPVAERKERRRRTTSRVGVLLDAYEADLKQRSYVNYRMTMSALRKRLKPHLSTDVRDVAGAELAAIAAKLREAGLPGAAEEFRARCRTFLTWCVVVAKALPANPMAEHRKQRATRADRIAKAERGRALSDTELTAVWHAADPETVFGRLMRFYVLTGCRRGEGAGLTWSMVDRGARVIRLPAAFVKQGRGHDVPIAPALAVLLDECPAGPPDGVVFASMRSGGPIAGWSKLLPQFCKAAGVTFTPHDLRRTFRTGLSRLGIDDDIAELALGHARSNLEAIYNRDDGAAALRKAFSAWAAHVEKVEAGVFG